MMTMGQQAPMGMAMPLGMNPAIYLNQPGYNQLQPIQMTTGLSKQEIEEMKKNGNGLFRMTITQEDMRRARCCHRDGNTSCLTLTGNGPQEVKCSICGEVFNLLENINPSMVTGHVKDTHDLLNTIKVMYWDLSPRLINEIFQVMPIMSKMGQLFTIAADRSAQLMGSAGQYGTSNQMNTVNGFNMYNSLMAGAAQQPMMMGMGGYPQQAPMMGYPQPQMMGYPQQPQMMPAQPAMGQYYDPNMMAPQAPMNQMQQQMTMNAPGINTNGFGMTTPDATPAAGQQITASNGATVENVTPTPTVTRNLQP